MQLVPKKLPVLPTVFKAILGGLKCAYEHLGSTAMLSFIWFVCHIPFWMVLYTVWTNVTAGMPETKEAVRVPWALVLAGLLVTGPLLSAPVNAAVTYVVKRIHDDEAVFKDFFIGFKRYYLRSAAVYAALIVVAALLVGNMTAAARMQLWVSKISLVISAYALLFLLLLSNYFFPLLVFQPNTFRKTWKKAFLLALDNGMITVLLSVLTLALYGLAGATGVFLILFYPAAIAHGHYLLFNTLLAKYEEAATEGSPAAAE